MTVEKLMERLLELLKAGAINPQDEVVVRDPSVSEDAMEAGSNGYHEVEEILAPRDGRVVLLGEVL